MSDSRNQCAGSHRAGANGCVPRTSRQARMSLCLTLAAIQSLLPRCAEQGQAQRIHGNGLAAKHHDPQLACRHTPAIGCNGGHAVDEPPSVLTEPGLSSLWAQSLCHRIAPRTADGHGLGAAGWRVSRRHPSRYQIGQVSCRGSRLRNSLRSDASPRKAPRMTLFVMRASSSFTPRQCMQKWPASIGSPALLHHQQIN